MKKILIGLMAISVGLWAWTKPATALELVITGNGSDSESEVSVDYSNEVKVNQTNETAVENDIEIEAETGGNSISGSVGDSTVITGDISVSTEVENSLNHTETKVSCCSVSEVEVTISGNGSGSDNQVDLKLKHETSVIVDMAVWVMNKLNTKAVTGDNEIKDSVGNAYIRTGDIRARDYLFNMANTAEIDVDCCGPIGVLAKISGNGADSENKIDFVSIVSTLIEKREWAELWNFLQNDFETGGNRIKDSVGEAEIITGDIDYEGEVINGPINVNVINVGGPIEQPGNGNGEQPPVTPPVTPPPAQNGGVSPVNGERPEDQQPQVLGEQDISEGAVLAAAGGILPVTGSLSLLLFVLANILMLLLGCYLRFRSGRAPNQVAV